MTGIRVPALDGVRGVAILAVLIGHGLGHRGDWLAVGGVTLFFVLSGYLITGRLQAGQTLRRFCGNRARRLLPAFAVMLTVTGWCFLNVGIPSARLVEAATYVSNVRVAHGGNPWTPWVHTWSLAMEEQFYLLWPLGFLLARRRGRLVAVVGALSLAAMVAAWLMGEVAVARFSPLTQAWTLCLGCWLALRGWSPRWPAWLEWPLLRWFGTRSYGMYLWHWPLLAAAGISWPGWEARWLALGVGVGIAALSWRYVEAPWLRRGRDSVGSVTAGLSRVG